MATGETARLIASLELQGDKFNTGINQALKGIDRIDSRVKSSAGLWKHTISTALGVGLERAVSAGIRGVFGALNAGMASLEREGVVVAQTNAVIRSTKGAANESAAAIRSLSQAVEAKTAIDDKDVQAGANLLLTFTNIRNEVGKGNDIFTQSVGVLADLSTAMGTDMSGGAVQLGKALNDPVKGITALTRVGVTFDAQQIKRIKNFQKEGKTAEAQKIILAELNKEFGGSGAAFAATDAGKAAKFRDAIEGIQQSIARGLLPAVTRIRGALTDFLSNPATMSQIEGLGNSIAGIFSEGNIKTAASAMTTAAGAISTAIGLFASLPPQVQALAVGALALKKITGIGPLDIVKGAGGLIKMVFERGATPANPLFVADVAGGGAAGGAVPAAGRLGKIGAAIGKVFLIGAAIGAFAELKGILDDQTAANKETIGNLTDQTTKFAGGASIADLRQALAGIQETEDRLNSGLGADNLAFQLNIDGVRTAIENQKAILRSQLDALIALRGDAGHPGKEDNRSNAKGPQGVPSFIDSPRTSPASLAALEAILKRGRDAGFKPTLAAAQATNQKNLERLASAQIVAMGKVRDAVQASDGTSELIGIRNAIAASGSKPPVTNVTVNVAVTAAQVKKSVTVQNRYGPSGGSRERGPTQFDE